MKKIFHLFFLFLITYNISAQESKLPTFITEELDAYIDQGMTDWQIPGLSVAIVKDGKVILEKGYGVLEKDGEVEVDEHTTFMIGSNTKAFTATALTILEQQGHLKISDKVKSLMPEFALKDQWASEEATLVDLLSHQIGFETFQGDFTYWLSDLSRAEVIQKMALIDAPYSLRSKWGYCNAAYVAAGETIQKVTGKSWEQTIRDIILKPLDMNRTLMLCKELAGATNNAEGHTIANDLLRSIPSHHLPNHSIDNLAAAGAMSSSASDMAKWLLAQLSMGEVNGKEVISKKAIHATREPFSILGLDTRNQKNTHFYLYGLGLMITDRAGKVVYSHTGGIDGFLSSVVFIPEEQLGIVVLTNTDQNNFYENLTDQIRDAFLDIPFENYSTNSLMNFKKKSEKTKAEIEEAKAVVSENHKPSVPLKAFTGVYNNTLYGNIEIKEENQKLKIYFSRHRELTAELEHMKSDAFMCTYSNPIFGVVEIPFTVKDGKVSAMTLTVADFVEGTPYHFEKKEAIQVK